MGSQNVHQESNMNSKGRYRNVVGSQQTSDTLHETPETFHIGSYKENSTNVATSETEGHTP